MHLDAERLLRYADGELQPDDAARIGAHVAECDVCRARVEQTHREWAEIVGRLRALDHPPPRITADALMARRAGARFRRLRIAAGIVLALAVAGSLYALPALRLPRWLGGSGQSAPARTASPIAEPSGSSQPAAPQAGIAVVPGAVLRIDVAAPHSSGVLRVRAVSDSAVAVRAALGVATFAASEQRLVVAIAQEGAEIDVDVPRTAPRVEIRVNDQLVLVAPNGLDDPTVRAGPGGVLRLPFAAAKP